MSHKSGLFWKSLQIAIDQNKSWSEWCTYAGKSIKKFFDHLGVPRGTYNHASIPKCWIFGIFSDCIRPKKKMLRMMKYARKTIKKYFSTIWRYLGVPTTTQGCLNAEFLISHQIASDQSKHGAEWCKMHEKTNEKIFFNYLRVPKSTYNHAGIPKWRIFKISSNCVRQR